MSWEAPFPWVPQRREGTSGLGWPPASDIWVGEKGSRANVLRGGGPEVRGVELGPGPGGPRVLPLTAGPSVPPAGDPDPHLRLGGDARVV